MDIELKIYSHKNIGAKIAAAVYTKVFAVIQFPEK